MKRRVTPSHEWPGCALGRLFIKLVCAMIMVFERYARLVFQICWRFAPLRACSHSISLTLGTTDIRNSNLDLDFRQFFRTLKMKKGASTALVASQGDRVWTYIRTCAWVIRVGCMP